MSDQPQEWMTRGTVKDGIGTCHIRITPEEREQIIAALAAEREKVKMLESQLHVTSVDASELLFFANLVEPYVSDAYCHGNTNLDKKLYQACLNVRKVTKRNVVAYLKGEKETK